MTLGIVIITKGNIPILTKCIDSIINTTSQDYTIYIGDTGSTQDEIDALKRYLKNCNICLSRVKLIQFNRYGFAYCNNTIIRDYVTEDLVLMCNNDIEVIDNCVDEMVELFNTKKNIGSVGCRLLYPQNGSVQHAGQIAKVVRDRAGRPYLAVTHRGLRTNNKYNSTWEKVMGNTAGFCMVSKDIFHEVGNLNESYTECFEDVEFNMNLLREGYDNYYADWLTCFHHESLTRNESSGKIRQSQIDHANTLTPFFNSLNLDTKQLILSFV